MELNLSLWSIKSENMIPPDRRSRLWPGCGGGGGAKGDAIITTVMFLTIHSGY